MHAPGFYEKLINSTGPQIKARKNLERDKRWLGKLGDQQRDDYVKAPNVGVNPLACC